MPSRKPAILAKPLGLLCAATLTLSACQGAGQSAEDKNTIEQMRADRPDDAKVVRVGESYIYASDIDRAARQQGLIGEEDTLSADHPRYQVFVDALVDQRLLSNAAVKAGYDKDPAVRRRVVLARERILSGVAIERHLAETVTEEAARALYDEQVTMRPRGEEVKAAHILVKTEDEAKAVIKRLEGGETFAALASELSIDPGSRINRGELGYFVKEAMVAPFAEAAFATPNGEITAPVQSEFGWHVIRVDDRRTPKTPSYEDMEDDIFNYLTYQEIERYKTKLRVDGDVERVSVSVDTPADDQTDDVPGDNPDEMDE